jgi:hypothetical protein
VSEFRVINGVQMPVRDLDFEIIKEPWLEYELADGGRVRVRAIVTGIIQVLEPDGSPAHLPDGQLWMICETNTTIGRVIH